MDYKCAELQEWLLNKNIHSTCSLSWKVPPGCCGCFKKIKGKKRKTVGCKWQLQLLVVATPLMFLEVPRVNPIARSRFHSQRECGGEGWGRGWGISLASILWGLDDQDNANNSNVNGKCFNKHQGRGKPEAHCSVLEASSSVYSATGPGTFWKGEPTTCALFIECLAACVHIQHFAYR